MRTLTDIALEQEWLEKSFKYLMKIPDGRGGYRYIYKFPSVRMKRGKFGEFLRNFRGKPAEAFHHLFVNKTGQALDVVSFNLPVVEYDKKSRKYVERSHSASTGVDLVWGNKNRGLLHILRNHFVFKNDFNSVKECEDELSASLLGLQNGTNRIVSKHFKSYNDKNAIDIERIGTWELVDSRGYKIVIDVEVQKDESGERYYRHLVLTDYDNTRNKADKENGSEIIEQRRPMMNKREY